MGDAQLTQGMADAARAKAARSPLGESQEGQRIRAYAKEVDIDYNRLKLTAARPRSLPRVPW